jgi:hypothetical protein
MQQQEKRIQTICASNIVGHRIHIHASLNLLLLRKEVWAWVRDVLLQGITIFIHGCIIKICNLNSTYQARSFFFHMLMSSSTNTSQGKEKNKWNIEKKHSSPINLSGCCDLPLYCPKWCFLLVLYKKHTPHNTLS